MRKFNLFLLFTLLCTPCFSDSESTISGKTAQAHIIQSTGDSLRPRPYLNFTGGIGCSDIGGKTVCRTDSSSISSDAQSATGWTHTSGQVALTNTSDKVGIGSTSPFYKLDIDGGIGLTGRITSTIATGTSPLDISSTTLNTNLNADLLDGLHSSSFIQSETDPKVGTLSANKLAKWGTTTLIDSAIYESSGNVGIGTTTPLDNLYVSSLVGGVTISQTATSQGGIDANTALMLHMDGANGGTTFTDSSTNNFTVTVGGQTNTSTTSPMFGTASALFDGNADYITVPDNAVWAWGTNNFTIDSWIKFTTVTGGLTHGIFSQYTDSNNRMQAYWSDTGTITFTVVSGGSVVITVNGTWSPSANTWYHVALVRDGSLFKWYVDGSALGSGTIDVDSVGNYTSAFAIGGRLITSDLWLNGRIDEFRASNTARWTSNFTPPGLPYDSTAGNGFSNPALTFNNSTSRVAKIHYDGATSSFRIAGASNDNITIDINGNVGINSTNPLHKLAVVGDSYFSGNIGIGSTVPTNVKLDVVGIGTTSSTSGLHLHNSSGVLMETHNDDGNVAIGTSTPSGRLDVHGAGTTTGVALQVADSSGSARLTVLDNGNIGVGTTSPSGKFDVHGSGTTTGVTFQTADSIGAAKFTILDNGNVGIGTTVPGGKLDVNGNIRTTDNSQYYSHGTVGYWGAGSLISGGTNSDTALRASANLLFSSGGNLERMRITSAGNVGINTTVPLANLEIVRSPSSQAPLKISSAAGQDGDYLTVTSGGRVGIGTTDPGALFVLSKDRVNGSIYVQEYLDAKTMSQTQVGSGIVTGYSRGNGATFFGAVGGYANGTLDQQGIGIWSAPTVTSDIVNGAPNLFVAGGGNVGINSTNPRAKLDVEGTVYAGGDVAIGNGTFNNPTGAEDLYVTGLLEVDGQIYDTGTFAEIYVNDGATSQSIPNGSTYTKLTMFTSDGESTNATADAANDKITITHGGKYRVNASVSASSGTANITLRTALFYDGAEKDECHIIRKFSAGGDPSTGNLNCIITSEANKDIDIRSRHDNGSAVDLTLIYGNLNIQYLGE